MRVPSWAPLCADAVPLPLDTTSELVVESLVRVRDRGAFGCINVVVRDAPPCGVYVVVDKLTPLSRYASTCRLKASNSGLGSSGTCLGTAAAKGLTEDEGGVQLWRGRADESRGSTGSSTTRPK